jgi:hypothetical protein
MRLTAQEKREAAAEVIGDDDGKRRDGPKSQATRLIEYAGDTDLFHDPDGNPFARVEVLHHHEVVAIRGRGFRRWLARRYYLCEGKAPSAQSLQDAISVLEGKALFDGAETPVFLRIAEHDGKVYVDLCNSTWQVVEIDADGWRVLDKSPVLFRRAKAMLPLPTPLPGGAVADLREYLNIADAEWPLAAGWVVGAYRPRGPYPVLAVHGEQGSAKSTGCRLLRSLIDPNSAPLRCEPREPRDLAIAANNGWLVVLDNLSHLRSWLSDGLCRLSTGGGFATRTLFENDEEQVFDSQRPVVVNGIEELAGRSDLLDRCLLVTLPRINASRRITESDLWARFDAARPRILGAVFSAVSAAIRNLPRTRLADPPRMADFAIWATAAEEGIGLAPGDFMAAYNANRTDANDLAVEACPVGKAIIGMVESLGASDPDANHWSGTATDLLTELSDRVGEQTCRSTAWPKSARSMTGAVRRLAPNLRAAGVKVEFLRQTDRKRTKVIVLAPLERESNCASTWSGISASSDSLGEAADAADASLHSHSNGAHDDHDRREREMAWLADSN